MLSEVREQSEAIRFLRRVVDGELTSPLLLVGNEGVGRRYSVIQAAKEAFSKGNPDSIHCVQIAAGTHPDFVVVRPPDGKDIGVDTIREVVKQAGSFPAMVPVRYVVIDGADAMTTPAANALLKTLEEPPVTSRFFLVASSAYAVLPTIRSRCGLVRYRPLSEKFIVDFLAQQTDDATKALVCARLSEGSVGRAYQYLASGRLALRNKMLSLLKSGLVGDLSSLFSIVDSVQEDLPCGLRFFEHLLHDLVMLPRAPSQVTNLDVADDLGVLREQLGEGRLEQLFVGLRELQGRMRSNIHLPFHVKTYLATTFEG
jgi:DNA polymerase-3 subunit delta'